MEEIQRQEESASTTRPASDTSGKSGFSIDVFAINETVHIATKIMRASPDLTSYVKTSE